MGRPMKFYVVWDWGRVVGIVEGLAAAKEKGPSYRAFPTRLKAEEYAAWWDYEIALNNASTPNHPKTASMSQPNTWTSPSITPP